MTPDAAGRPEVDAEKFAANFGEQEQGVDGVVLAVGSAKAIQRIAGDIMACGFGFGEAGQTPAGREWMEKAYQAKGRLMRHVDRLGGRARTAESEATRLRAEVEALVMFAFREGYDEGICDGVTRGCTGHRVSQRLAESEAIDRLAALLAARKEDEG